MALEVDADADGQQYVLEDGDTVIRPTSDVTNGEAASSGAFREIKRPLPLCRRIFLPTLPGCWFSR